MAQGGSGNDWRIRRRDRNFGEGLGELSKHKRRDGLRRKKVNEAHQDTSARGRKYLIPVVLLLVFLGLLRFLLLVHAFGH
jgi:hypothetical protein